MTARVDLDAVDLTTLVEGVAAKSYDRWRRHMAQQYPNREPEPAWDDLPQMGRHSHREMLTPIVADVLTGLREQVVS